MAVNRKIVTEILDYVGADRKSTWYVGIATNPEMRLFHDHNVDRENDLWIYRPVNSEVEARDTERYLLDFYGFKGGTGGGDNPRFVYAYKITFRTNS